MIVLTAIKVVIALPLIHTPLHQQNPTNKPHHPTTRPGTTDVYQQKVSRKSHGTLVETMQT